ncbi:hypothetical protein KEM56_001123 [Ascosphaera pollenicola]|nr:hypothetical protein KEM56_001123 [Ascosphaera pollenicola]
MNRPVTDQELVDAVDISIISLYRAELSKWIEVTRPDRSKKVKFLDPEIGTMALQKRQSVQLNDKGFIAWPFHCEVSLKDKHTEQHWALLLGSRLERGEMEFLDTRTEANASATADVQVHLAKDARPGVANAPSEYKATFKGNWPSWNSTLHGNHGQTLRTHQTPY